ncbi:MAG: hypothetical protein WCQ64_07275 [Acidobacteriota bacterium]
MRLTSALVAALCVGLMVALTHAQAGGVARIDAYATRQSVEGRMQIITSAQLPAGSKWTAATIAVLDTHGKSLVEWKAPATLLSSGELTATFLQNPGAFRLHLTATDSARRSVTADTDVTATLTSIAGGLSVSPIAFGLDGSTFQPRREFTAEPQALARFELYGGKTGMAVSVTMELAASADGPAIAKLTPKITPTPETDRFVVTAAIDLSRLVPAKYVVRSVGGVDGQPATAFQGHFEKR